MQNPEKIMLNEKFPLKNITDVTFRMGKLSGTAHVGSLYKLAISTLVFSEDSPTNLLNYRKIAEAFIQPSIPLCLMMLDEAHIDYDVKYWEKETLAKHPMKRILDDQMARLLKERGYI